MPEVRLLIVTTVPITLRAILREQPRYLSTHFTVELATTMAGDVSDIEAVESVPVNPVSMARRISPLRDLRSIWEMAKVIRRFRPHIVHSYTPKAGLVAMAASWLCRVPVRIHTFTGLIFPSQSGLKREILRLIDSLICLLATRVVPEGEGVKEDLIAYSVTSKPLQIIGHGNIAGVDTEHYSRQARDVMAKASRLASSLNIGKDDFVFCFVGRLNPDKGIRELVEGFQMLPANSRLLLVGDADDTARLDVSTMNDLHRHARIHAIGYQQDIRPALAASDVLVLPSYREGFPNVVLQAGAMNLPVIATDIGGSNEIIKPGFNGWLVPPHDARALAGTMREAMNTPEPERAAMGRQARQRIRARFERAEHWQRMVAFYRSELDGQEGA